jgi:hypothetical protein
MSTREVVGHPVKTLQSEVKRYDALLRAAQKIQRDTNHDSSKVGAIRLQVDILKARRAVVLALGALQADDPAGELRAMRASALASSSFASATELATQERAAAEEVEAATMSIADVISGMSLPDRIALAAALADSVSMRLVS